MGASPESVVGNLTEAYWSERANRSRTGNKPHRPLHVAHTLLGALVLESLTRWCARSSSVQDLRDRQRVSSEAMQTLQTLSIERSYGSLPRQTGGGNAVYVVAGRFAEVPKALAALARVKEVRSLFLNCPNLTTLPKSLRRRGLPPNSHVHLTVNIKPCPASGNVEPHENFLSPRLPAAPGQVLQQVAGENPRTSAVYERLLAQTTVREQAWFALRNDYFTLGGCEASAFGDLGEIASNAALQDGYAGGDEPPTHRIANMQMHGWQDALLGPVFFDCFTWYSRYGSTGSSKYGDNAFFSTTSRGR